MQAGTANPAATNWWFEIGKILIPAILAFFGGILSEKYRKRQTRNVRAAGYFETMAKAIEGMADSFANHQIPYADGHLLEALIDAFDETTRRLVDDDLLSTLKRLNVLASRAIEIDSGLISGDAEQDNDPVGPFIKDARRVAGDLKGKAAILLAG